MLERHTLGRILQVFSDCGSTVTEFITTLLVDSTLSDHLLVLDITANALDIIITLLHHPLAHHPITHWAHDLVIQSFTRSLRDLSRIDNGWHFGAVNASVQQIGDFRIEDMARHLQSATPALWNTIYCLLSSSSPPASDYKPESNPNTEPDATADDENEAQFWKDFINPAESSEGSLDPTDGPRPWHQWKRSEHRDAI
jgi:hypothetical protein